MSTSINYKYYIDSDYEPHYVNGVYGGVNISGELVANFYFERLPIPYEEQIEMDDDFNVKDLKVVEPDEFKVRRAVKTGIVMDLVRAKELYNWLGDILSDEGVLDDDIDDHGAL